MLYNMIKFLQGKKGERSSKRLAFLFGLLQLSIMVIVSLIYAFYHNDGVLILDIIQNFGLCVLVMGGFVTAEVFKKK